MALVSERIGNGTLERLKLYDHIRGVTPTIPFWDAVVLIAADHEQRRAFEEQLTDKIRRNELPVTQYLAVNSTDETDLGGALLNSLSELSKRYGEELSRMKILIIPAGGYSMRLPIASLLGKIFTALPFGNPMYDMLDAKLVSLVEFPAKMDSGIFITSADSLELYACCNDVHGWRFPSTGITAQGHPSPINIGTMHGVFVLAHDQVTECSEKVEVVECLKVLQKKSKAELQENGACLHPSFARVHGVDDEMVLVDSGFLVNNETVSKLVSFCRVESPIQCAIDPQMIFQVLGPQADTNLDYMTPTSNLIDKQEATSPRTEMTLKVSRLLKNTQLNVLVQSHSAFYHIGTSCEYLEHLRKGSELGKILGFKRNTFNYNQLDDTKLNEDLIQVSSNGNVRACVMHSILPEHFDWSHSCIVEYCDIRGSVSIQDNTIVSNCCISLPGKEVGVRVILSHTVLQTACVKAAKHPFVTFTFDVRDNLKQAVSRSDVGNMIFMGKRFWDIFGEDVNEVCDTIFPCMKVCSLWQAKLFRPSATMDKAFDAALSLLDKLSARNASFDFQGCLSMADIVKQRDLSATLAYRRALKESITE